MTITDNTVATQAGTIAFDLDLQHPPEKVWRTLTEPALLAEWLLPAFGLQLQPGAAFTFKNYEHVTMTLWIEAMEPERLFSFRWHPYAIEPGVDYSAEPTTLVTFTLTPTERGTHLSLVQSGFKPEQKREFGGARYGWKMMGGKLADLLARLP